MRTSLAAFSALFAACGAEGELYEPLDVVEEELNLSELKQVELYTPTDGVPASFIQAREPMVTRINFTNEEGRPSFCSGTLLDDGLLLTAGHCNITEGNRVYLNKQLDPNGNMRPEWIDHVAENVEEIHRRDDDGRPVDFRLVRLFFNAERRWGATSISTVTPELGDTVALIGIPGIDANPQRTEMVDTGHINSSNSDGALRYDDLAQAGGDSGGGIIKFPEGVLYGYHKGAGGISMNFAAQVSSVIDGDKASGALFSVDGTSMSQVSKLGNWSSSWRYLVPGRFDADSTDDLLFVNEANARFYRVTSSGNISALGSTLNFANKWSQAIPVDWDGAGTTEVFFYESGTGKGELWSPDGSGGMNRLMSKVAFAPAGCRLAGSGDLLSNAGNELVIYCPKDNHQGELIVYGKGSTPTGAFAELFKIGTGLNENYTQLVVGEFDSTQARSEIMLYDPWSGKFSFFKLGTNSLSLIREQSIRPPGSRLFSQVVAGDFTSQSGTELLVYDPGRGIVRDENLPGAAPGVFIWYSVSRGTMTIRGSRSDRHSLARVIPGKFQSGVTRTQLFVYDRYRQCLASSPGGHCFQAD